MSLSKESQEIQALTDAMERLNRIGRSGLYEMEHAINSLASKIKAQAEYDKTIIGCQAAIKETA